MSQRKSLRTTAEIDAAYPVHAEVKRRKAEIEAVQRFLRYIHAQGVRLCVQPEGDEQEGWEYMLAPGWTGSFDPGGVPSSRVYAALGINYDAFMAEKDDMLDQLRLAQEDDLHV